MVSSIIQMAAITKVIGLMVNKKDLELILGQVEVSMSEDGKTDYDMVKGK